MGTSVQLSDKHLTGIAQLLADLQRLSEDKVLYKMNSKQN